MKPILPLVAVLAAFAASPALAAPDSLAGAKTLMSAGRYSAAETTLRALASKSKGEDVKVLSALAECQIARKDFKGATKTVNEALDQRMKSADLWKLFGRVAFEHGLDALSKGTGNPAESIFPDAESRYKHALALNPDDPDLLWMIGWAMEQQLEPAKAEGFYRQEIAKYPKNPAGYRRLGSLLLAKANRTQGGKTPTAKKIRQQAVDTFDEGLKNAGPDAETLYLKGYALWWSSTADAVKCFVQSIKTDPDFNKAWLALSNQQLGYAAKDFLALAQDMHTKHPASADAAAWTAFLLYKAQRYPEALAVALPALAKYRENSMIYQQAFNAACQVAQSDPKTGNAAFEKIDKYYPFSADAANNLGMYYRDTARNPKLSLKWYLRAVEKEPENQDILNDAALIYLFYFKGAAQKKALPIFLKVVSLVQDKHRAPQRGYWDTLENLCKYYTEVEHDPKKVIHYAEMRYETTNGVDPYNLSPRAHQYEAQAKKDLGIK